MSRGALLLAVAVVAACTEPARPVPALDERHVITVDGTTVRYNGRLLDWSAGAKRWEEVLGAASLPPHHLRVLRRRLPGRSRLRPRRHGDVVLHRAVDRGEAAGGEPTPRAIRARGPTP
ncbi:hypothetical protein [Anaeromyxobacter oryzisoli]|uniref:hypothetical protein n=1 Tax=Anaeromyxobacter oryzisoli TaxID=2925408 RepID=UPI001F597927|nr:hypothetical protein [Anaeromyxobacter sp. SG63]